MRLIVLFLVLSQCVFGQKTLQITVCGIDSNSMRYSSKIRFNKPCVDSLTVIFTLSKTIEKIRNDGFLAASFDTIVYKNDTATAYLNLGEKYTSGRINLSSLSTPAFRFADFNKKTISISEYLKKRSTLISFYLNNGYPFTSLLLDSVAILRNGINANLVVDSYKLVKIKNIRITGYVKTKPKFFESHIQLAKGDIYCQSKIDKIKNAINELAFVELTDDPMVEFDSDSTVVISMNVKKRSANTFDGLVGFATDPNNNYKLTLTGNIAVELQNMFEYGESMFVNWQKIDANSQKINVGYNVRYLFASRLGSVSEFQLYKKDSSFVNSQIYSAIPYYLAFNKLVKAYVTRKTSSLINQSVDTNSLLLPQYSNMTQTSYGLGFKLWDLDYFFNPRKGYVTEFEIASGQKNIEKNAKLKAEAYKNIPLQTTQVELKGNVEVFIPFFAKTVVYVKNTSALIHAKTIFSNELYYIGGTKTLRGFDENEIPCSRYTIGTIEFRYLFQKSSNVYVFYNQAYYENRATTKYIYDTPWGFGIGFHIQNKSSIFSISYAYGSQFNNPIKYNEAKIHFGFINTF